MITYDELMEMAVEARLKAYTPYSKFKVGAALLTKDGKVYTGCNIENAAFTPTSCAERTAFFKAVSEGDYEFEAIAIVGGSEDSKELGFCSPCGVCRQVMKEFCEEEFKILLHSGMSDGKHSYEVYTLKDILPYGFGPKDMKIRPQK